MKQYAVKWIQNLHVWITSIRTVKILKKNFADRQKQHKSTAFCGRDKNNDKKNRCNIIMNPSPAR